MAKKNPDPFSDDEIQLPSEADYYGGNPPPPMPERFDINSLDVSNPQQVYAFKNHIVRTAYNSAIDGGKEASGTVAALKNLMEILVEAEKQYNVIRQEQLQGFESTIDQLEIRLDNLSKENADLKAKLARATSHSPEDK